MHNLLDDYAHGNALRETNARLKLIFGLGAILLCVSSTTPIAPLFVAITMSLATLILAKIPGRIYFRLLLVPLSFALLSAAVVAFMHGAGQTLFSVQLFGLNLGIREEGANLAALLIARTFGGMCSLFFIALTTPMIEIFATLKSLRIPQSVIELSMMIYRYIFVFLDQAAMIHSAQVMRLGDAGTKNSLTSFAMLSSVLFLRSWEQGERLIVAMDSRCYDGKLDFMEQAGRAKPMAILAVALYLASVAAIAVLTRGVQLL
ncbi:MAG TPA: cobalt ECF transporter T component CbiQ [Methanothrix sp.]|nr:cobalt ECF transporter T component CbiQ [Methanothrix sp.]